MSQPFDFERLVELCRRTHEETRHSAARAVDRSLVVRNWLFGWYVVEYEQSGADRAEYGAQTLKKLSAALKERIGRGFSVDALERMRRFYLSHDRILSNGPASDNSATPSRISGSQPRSATPLRILAGSSAATTDALAQLAERLPLGWSHYVTLLSVTDPETRRFYEIEAAENGWSVRELKRQLAVRSTSGSPSAATSRKSAASPVRARWLRRRRPEDANIYASKYQLYLPSREELADQVARVRREIEGSAGAVDG